MNDDLESKIKQIADMLNSSNKEEMPDGLMSIINMMKNKGSEQDSKNEPESEKDDTIELMLKLKKIMDKTNMKSDPKVALLKSIKPFLKDTRQDRINNCIKFMSLSSVTKHMDIFDNNG